MLLKMDIIFSNLDKITYYMFGVASVLGLLVSLYILAKVKSVRKVQEKERKFLQRVYGLEKLVCNLEAASAILGRSRDLYSKELAHNLLHIVGQIQGINQALRLSDASIMNGSEIQFLGKNYFTTNFLTQLSSKASKILDILCYRNMLVTGIDVVESFHKAASRGVRIRVLAIASSAPDYVLKEALKFLPQPRVDSSDSLMQQLVANERRIINSFRNQWSKNVSKMLQYRGYTIIPTLHFIRSDNLIYVGFLNVLHSAQSKYLDDRPCIQIAAHSTLGKQLVAHFDTLWDISKEVVPYD